MYLLGYIMKMSKKFPPILKMDGNFLPKLNEITLHLIGSIFKISLF